MWFDIMYLFQYCCCQYTDSFTPEKSALYIVALTLSMIMNFYISFMNAIFIILGFVLYCGAAV